LREKELNYAGGEMVKYEMIDLPIIAIIGKEGLCAKEKELFISERRPERNVYCGYDCSMWAGL
jgi:hypothetical protein